MNAQDVNQGYLGNCWFLSTIANLAETPGAIPSLFLNTDNAVEPAGIYGVKFFLLGRPYIVCLLYTSPSPRDATLSRMPSSA